MLDQRIFLAGIAFVLLCSFGPGTAFATVKCQCNDGTIEHAMGEDYDDDDVADACNDACDEFGGGRVWNEETDENSEDVTVDRGERRHEEHKPEIR